MVSEQVIKAHKSSEGLVFRVLELEGKGLRLIGALEKRNCSWSLFKFMPQFQW